MLLDDMLDYLSSGGVGTPGTNLFAGYLPDSPDTCTAVYETGGMASVHTMNPAAGQAVLECPRVQVVCRGLIYDYATTRATAHAAFKLLDGLPARTINGVAYKWGAAVQSPFPMGRDANGRVMIAANYEIYKDLTP